MNPRNSESAAVFFANFVLPLVPADISEEQK